MAAGDAYGLSLQSLQAAMVEMKTGFQAVIDTQHNEIVALRKQLNKAIELATASQKMDATTASPGQPSMQQIMCQPEAEPCYPTTAEMYPELWHQFELMANASLERKKERKAEEAAKQARMLERQKYLAEKKLARQKYLAEKKASVQQLLGTCCPFATRGKSSGSTRDEECEKAQ